MRKRFCILLVVLSLLSLGMPEGISDVVSAPGDVANRSLLQGVRELVLPNGMKFLLLRRPGAPVFTAYIRVKVGGIDEAEGQTGIAHLLEHMAFKGTHEIGTKNYAQEKVLLEKVEVLHEQARTAKGDEKRRLKNELNQLLKAAGEWVIKEEFSKIYQRNGATGLNATTSQDLTSYFVTLPKHKLKLWAFLESSRLRDPVFREFYSERDVVKEERRMRVDDSAFGKLYETFVGLAFEKSPYRRPTIGYQVDVEKLSATQLRRFYDTYYVPSNMVGAIVGNVDLAETESILRQYFGNIPSGKKPPRPRVKEPEPTRAKQRSISFDASPALMFGYLKPNMPDPDDYIFDVLQEILCEGRSSRLYKNLLIQKRLVQQISCSPGTPGSRLDNLFFVYAAIRNGHNADEVLQAFDEQIRDLSQSGPSEQELLRAKKKVKSTWYFDLQSNADIARALSYFESIAGDWKYIVGHMAKIQAVTKKDVQRVLTQYIQPQRRRTVVLKPLRK